MISCETDLLLIGSLGQDHGSDVLLHETNKREPKLSLLTTVSSSVMTEQSGLVNITQ